MEALGFVEGGPVGFGRGGSVGFDTGGSVGFGKGASVGLGKGGAVGIGKGIPGRGVGTLVGEGVLETVKGTVRSGLAVPEFDEGGLGIRGTSGELP